MGTLCSNQGEEYMSKKFNAFLASCGIKDQCIVPCTPQQYEISKKENMSLMEMTRCIIKSQAIPHDFWLKDIMCAIMYVLNK